MQHRTPLVQAIQAYQAKKRLRQHMPGHKGQAQANALFEHWGELAAWDLTEAEGLDDLHAPEGPIRQAAELLAQAVGAKQAHLLVNGASVGILAAILAATAQSPGCSILLPRNAHRACWNGLALAGCQPVWLPVEYDKTTGLPLGITPKQLQQAAAQTPAAKAAFFVYPSYYGVCVDLAALLSVCRQHKLISIVDEAHGAHLPFTAPEQAAARLGADLVIESWHKTMGSLGQTAVLLSNSQDDLQPERWLTMLQTSSPSYPLLASLDVARAEWCAQQAERRQALAQERAILTETLQKCNVLQMLQPAELPSGFSYDESKALLYSAAGHSGWQLAEALRQAGMEPEFADWHWVLLLLSFADCWQSGGWPALTQALQQADLILQQTPAKPVRLATANLPLPQQIFTPAETMRQPVRMLPLAQTAGHVAAGLLTPYPPGIPWLGPGELIEPWLIEAAEALLQAGGRLQGLTNGCLPVLAIS